MNAPVMGDADYYGPTGAAGLGATSPSTATPGLGAAAFRGSAGGGADEEEVAMDVPNNIVGSLIGRGGENIQNIQRDSGCHVQVRGH